MEFAAVCAKRETTYIKNFMTEKESEQNYYIMNNLLNWKLNDLNQNHYFWSKFGSKIVFPTKNNKCHSIFLQFLSKIISSLLDSKFWTNIIFIIHQNPSAVILLATRASLKRLAFHDSAQKSFFRTKNACDLLHFLLNFVKFCSRRMLNMYRDNNDKRIHKFKLAKKVDEKIF